jgi:hypothetical protein
VARSAGPDALPLEEPLSSGGDHPRDRSGARRQDVVASVDFWHVRVGFETDEIHGDPPSFVMPTRHAVTVQDLDGHDIAFGQRLSAD